jgi:hypothetical protein
MVLHNIRHKSTALVAVAGFGVLLAGCAPRDRVFAATQANTGALAGAPLAVSCEPNQRAVVRQVVNGTAQVQCETIGRVNGQSNDYAVSTPVAYEPAFHPVSYTQPLLSAPTRLVGSAYPVTREAVPQRVIYQRAPARVIVRKPKRSVQKSAIIIGSSAGVGAGIGAAFAGKKGAGIGALLGGGGAALWDQITRHKQ